MKSQCDFCGKTATKRQYKPSRDYKLAYDLCTHCATDHREAWFQVSGKTDVTTNELEAQS